MGSDEMDHPWFHQLCTALGAPLRVGSPQLLDEQGQCRLSGFCDGGSIVYACVNLVRPGFFLLTEKMEQEY
jgi:hypothetical protein